MSANADSKRWLSPKEFLKARRPQRFSDSVREERPALDRPVLENLLLNLTSRGEERLFERFARRLIEHEVCPNLLPQTGPTGGGDSKVDSETFPVAPRLALAWYVGSPDTSTERWAFAFSAKERWRDKLRPDIGKIAGTRRNYTKAFFATNQYVRDRERAELEDGLSRGHNLDVRILDLTWILTRVFANHREIIAVEELHLPDSMKPVIRRGPLDTQREQDLEELEDRIVSCIQRGNEDIQLVDDCIRAAVLSRGLERSRIETSGRFDRAERVAEQYGTTHQVSECLYQRAWTAFWWYEDYRRLAELYRALESRVAGSRNVHDLEMLVTIWHLLVMVPVDDHVPASELQLNERTATLGRELSRLAGEEGRPSTALQARALRLQMDMLRKAGAGAAPDETLHEFQEVIKESEPLVGFPLMPLAEVLTEMGEDLTGNKAYEELVELLVEVVGRRNGEVSSGLLLLKQGERFLKRDQPYDALRVLGRCLRMLHKHESRHQEVHALYLCGRAYEQIGLLWAARGTTLTAASLATDELWKYGQVTTAQGACYDAMKWDELRLGRLPHALAWYQTSGLIGHLLKQKGHVLPSEADERLSFDALLGVLLLRTDFQDLSRLTHLPDALEAQGLNYASLALLYALGHEDELVDVNKERESELRRLDVLFNELMSQPGARDIPGCPHLCMGKKVQMEARIVGFRVALECVNQPPCIQVAETLLSALEAFLATATSGSFMAREPLLAVTVRHSEFARLPFEWSIHDEKGWPRVEIRCGSFDPNALTMEEQDTVWRTLTDAIAGISARMVTSRPEDLERLLREDGALGRTIGFTGSFVTEGNVLGERSSILESKDPGARDYPLMRTKAWTPSRTGEGNTEKEELAHAAESDPEDAREGAPILKHSDVEVESLIRESLWEKAGWYGVGFIWFPDRSRPPILSLMFSDKSSGKEIFAQWIHELGRWDPANRLRVTLIRGVDRSNPFHYRVVVGSNIARSREKGAGLVTSLARVHTMTPSSDKNLSMFSEAYGHFHAYGLAPAFVRDGGGGPEPLWDRIVLKREIWIRDAWTVGRHDPDAVGIQPDDDPIIPEGELNPPVNDLLKWKRSL